MKLDLQDYEQLELSREEAYTKAAELLGLSIESTTDLEIRVNNYIDDNYTLRSDDEEYQYMGYDCGDCYIGGDIKEGILCGEFLMVYVFCPNYKHVRIYQKK